MSRGLARGIPLVAGLAFLFAIGCARRGNPVSVPIPEFGPVTASSSARLEDAAGMALPGVASDAGFSMTALVTLVASDAVMTTASDSRWVASGAGGVEVPTPASGAQWVPPSSAVVGSGSGLAIDPGSLRFTTVAGREIRLNEVSPAEGDWTSFVDQVREGLLTQFPDARFSVDERLEVISGRAWHWRLQVGDEGQTDPDEAEVVVAEAAAEGRRGIGVVAAGGVANSEDVRASMVSPFGQAVQAALPYVRAQILTPQEEAELFMRLTEIAYERRDLNIWVLTHSRSWLNEWFLGWTTMRDVMRRAFFQHPVVYDWRELEMETASEPATMRFLVTIRIESTLPLIGGVREGRHRLTLILENRRWRLLTDDVVSGQGFRFFNRLPRFIDPPSPPNLSQNVALETELGWRAFDPDGDPLTYDLYFSTSDPPGVLLDSSLATTTRRVQLQKNRKYYWQVVARDPAGASVRSSVWRMSTTSDPNVPERPSPSAGQSQVPVREVMLSWNCTDPDGDQLFFEVRLATVTPPVTIIASGHSEPRLAVAGPLPYGTNHYWQVVARDAHGGIREGPIWRFQTEPDVTRHPLAFADPADRTVTGLRLRPLQIQRQGQLFDLFFRVVDQAGRDLGTLNRHNFSVRVAANPIYQESTYVSTHRTGGALRASLTMDYSFSMEPRLNAQIDAALALIRAKSSADQWQIVKMSDTPRIRSFYAALLPTIEAGIQSAQVVGRGVLYDALLQEITGLGANWGQKAVVAFCDGGDEGSIQPVTSVVRAAQRYSIPLFFVALPGADVQHLRDLAADTNGEVFVASAWDQVASAALALDAALDNTYHLTFNSAGTTGVPLELWVFYESAAGRLSAMIELVTP